MENVLFESDVENICGLGGTLLKSMRKHRIFRNGNIRATYITADRAETLVMVGGEAKKENDRGREMMYNGLCKIIYVA